jgi:hypothetical protein
MGFGLPRGEVFPERTGKITCKELGRGDKERLKGYSQAFPDGHDVCTAAPMELRRRIELTETGEVKARDRVKGKRG